MSVDGAQNMKLYVTYGSPYARLARIMVIEKALEDRVEIIEAKTRTPGSPCYQINPSGRVPYLVDDTGVGMEDSQLICAYLDGLDGKPRFHSAAHASDRAYLRLEFAARSMCDGHPARSKSLLLLGGTHSHICAGEHAGQYPATLDLREPAVDEQCFMPRES
jgi:glutathione S-transferase